MKGVDNARKTVAGRDDVSLTRWVKMPGRGHSGRGAAPMPLEASGTRYLSRVMDPDDRPLVSGHSNLKIGRDVRKGPLKGYWIYTLTLEERATCPSTCLHWTTCYGNGSPFARRLRHGPMLEAAIAGQLGKLLSVRGRKGVLIRLHALGDFYSVGYVRFWREMLLRHPNLVVYGYTAHSLTGSLVGVEVAKLGREFGKRWMIRESNGRIGRMDTVTIASVQERPDHAFVCPEQTNKTQCCATCAACWSTEKTVAFLSH